MTLFLVLSAIVLTAVITLSKGLDKARVTSDISAEARIALERIAREVRQSAEDVSQPALTSSRQRQAVCVDFDGSGTNNGSLADPEVVTYAYDPARQSIRMTALDSLRTALPLDSQALLAGQVRAMRLAFKYRSSNWANATGPTATSPNPADVDRVEISLTSRAMARTKSSARTSPFETGASHDPPRRIHVRLPAHEDRDAGAAMLVAVMVITVVAVLCTSIAVLATRSTRAAGEARTAGVVKDLANAGLAQGVTYLREVGVTSAIDAPGNLPHGSDACGNAVVDTTAPTGREAAPHSWMAATRATTRSGSSRLLPPTGGNPGVIPRLRRRASPARASGPPASGRSTPRPLVRRPVRRLRQG